MRLARREIGKNGQKRLASITFERLFLSSKDPHPVGRETFSHLIYTDLRDDKNLDQYWLKLANWLRSHIPVLKHVIYLSSLYFYFLDSSGFLVNVVGFCR